MNFHSNKRRIEERKKKKRQEKLSRRQNKPAAPGLEQKPPETVLSAPPEAIV